MRGQTLTFAGSFADPNEDNWTATVQYGDGTASQPLVLNGNKSFQFSHVYNYCGNYTITVTVVDGEGGTVSIPSLFPCALLMFSCILTTPPRLSWPLAAPPAATLS